MQQRYGVDETRMRIQGLLGREENPDADSFLQLAGELADRHEELHAEVQASDFAAGRFRGMLKGVDTAIPAEEWRGGREASIGGMAARIQQLEDRCADLEAEKYNAVRQELEADDRAEMYYQRWREEERRRKMLAGHLADAREELEDVRRIAVALIEHNSVRQQETRDVLERVHRPGWQMPLSQLAATVVEEYFEVLSKLEDDTDYTFREYQEVALRTSSERGSYYEKVMLSALGLAGEAGEVAEHIKKCIRDGRPLTPEAIMDELGDVLWYVADMATIFSLSLAEVAQANRDKLFNRYPDGFDEERSINRDDDDLPF